MDEYTVRTAAKEYPVYFENTFAKLPDAFKTAGLAGRRVVIVSDSNVAPLYLGAVREALAGAASHIGECVFPAGEESKTLGTISFMYERFLEEKLDRKSVVVALGGGVTGDMAGFAAATYMRGIPFVQLPTTLLAQTDSSVGGKTGVDFMGMKNMIGAFYQPEFVYMNMATLQTLPRAQIISGLGEVVKHGLILDEGYFNYLCDNVAQIAALAPEVMAEVVRGSCRIKENVVSQDERESGLREILNYGHTFGHAIETCYDFKLPHGHCVALGIVCACAYAVADGSFAEDGSRRTAEALALLGLPVRLPADMPKPPAEDIYTHMLADKKTHDQTVRLVLPVRIGAVRRAVCTDRDAVTRAIRAIY